MNIPPRVFDLLTIKPDNTVEFILIKLVQLAPCQHLHGEGRMSGQGAEAREEIDCHV